MVKTPKSQEAPLKSKKPADRSTLLICLLLFLVTLCVYSQVWDFDFTNLDDDIYIVHNQHIQSGITASSIKWAFTDFEQAAMWLPVPWISYMADYSVNELNPIVFHLSNLAFHLANVLLLFFLLYKLTGFRWRSAFIAALFSIHPMHVDSVAWVTERKDLLCALFWILATISYLSYTKDKKLGFYILTATLFALSLMSKAMAVTFPLTLLLLDFWPLQRNLKESWTKLAVEKLPLFALSAACAAITMYASHHSENIVQGASLGVRLANGAVSYLHYILRMFWPTNLSVLYPNPMDTLPVWQVAASYAVLAIVTIAAIAVRRKKPYITFGWFFFFLTLLPVSGIVMQGKQVTVDHFTYLPHIGLFIIAAWGAKDILGSRKNANTILVILGLYIVLALIIPARTQTAYWSDSFTLCTHAVKVADNNPHAHYNLALAYDEMEDEKRAVKEFEKVVHIDPGYYDAHNNLGVIYTEQAKYNRAMQHLETAIKLKPSDPKAHLNMGILLLKLNCPKESIEELKVTLKLKPDYDAARFYLKEAEAKSTSR